MADLLVSYLNKAKTYGTQAAAPLDISTKERIKPFEDKGTLVPSRIFGSPIEYMKDTGKDIVNIGKGVKGKSNDYKLGRMNDIGMKIGSLAIATYLLVKNPLKLSKTMEFVGFGSFFASMALWPKLFIQLPLKLKTGVDIHRKYIDSENRKKIFFQDPKYVPWSLVSQEELDKIGKKNNIREDIPNRNDEIKATAQKIAVQGNTLWMMTAGFATPVMSSLICRSVEKPIADFQLKTRLKGSEEKVKKLLNPITREELHAQEYKATSEAAKATLADILRKYGDKEMTPDVIHNMVVEMAGDLQSCQNDIKKQLSEMVKVPTTEIKDDIINQLMKHNRALFEKAGLNVNDFKGLVGAHLTPDRDYEYATKALADDIARKCSEEVPAQTKEVLKSRLIKSLATKSPVKRAATANECKQQLGQISDLLASFNADRNVVQQYINARTAQTADSFIAHQWKEVNDELFNALGITKKDLIHAKSAGKETETLLVQKLEALVKDPIKYKKAMEKMSTVIEEYDRTLSTMLMDGGSGKSYEEIAKTAINNITNTAALRFKNAGFTDIARTFVGYDIEKGLTSVEVGSFKNTLTQMAEYQMLGARTCFYRMFEALDLYKRVQGGTIEKQLKALGGHIDGLNSSSADISNFLWKKILGTLSDEKASNVKENELVDAITRKTANEHGLVQKLSLLSITDEGKANAIIEGIEQQVGNENAKEREEAITNLMRKNIPGSPVDKKYFERINALAQEHMSKDLPSDYLVNRLEIKRSEHNFASQIRELAQRDKGKADFITSKIDEIMKLPRPIDKERAVKRLLETELATKDPGDAVRYVKNATKGSSFSAVVAQVPQFTAMNNPQSIEDLAQGLFELSLDGNHTWRAGKIAESIDIAMSYPNLSARKNAIEAVLSEQLVNPEQINKLEQYIHDAIDYSGKKFPRNKLTEQVHAAITGSEDIGVALENVFGRRLKSATDFHGALQKLSNLQWRDKEKTEYILKSIDDMLPLDDSAEIEENISALIRRTFVNYENDPNNTFPGELKDELINFIKSKHSKGSLSVAFEEFEDNRSFWANIANAMSTYDEKRIATIVNEIKNNIVKGKITDQAEKLFASPDEYKAIMSLLHQQNFDTATQEVLDRVDGTTGKSLFSNLTKGIKQVRKDIVEYLGVTESWRYPGRNMIGFGTAPKPDFKHRLVAKSLVDTIKDHADTTFNSAKWLKLFGGGFAALIGVTLVAELFFGKKDASIQGGKK